MEQELHMAFIASLFAIFSLSFSWKLGYFTFPLEEEKGSTSPSLFSVVIIFCLYFLIELLFVPVVGSVYLFFYKKNIGLTQDATFLHFRYWLTACSLFFATLSISLYSLTLPKNTLELIWNRSRHKNNLLFKDIYIGIMSWVIAFPVIVALGHIVAFIVLKITLEPRQVIDQVAVKYLKALYYDPLLFWTTAFAIAFVIPIAEELLFRGFLQTWIQEKLGIKWAIFITSLLFAFMHFSSEQRYANWELLTSLFVLSCFLGFIYERQRTLWASISLHATFNTITILLITRGMH